MVTFVQANPGISVAVGALLIGVIVYLYKKNENTSAMLIADKLDEISLKIERLFQYNEAKDIRLSAVEDRVTRMEQKCEDREKSCPGLRALEGMVEHKKESAKDGRSNK